MVYKYVGEQPVRLKISSDILVRIQNFGHSILSVITQSVVRVKLGEPKKWLCWNFFMFELWRLHGLNPDKSETNAISCVLKSSINRKESGKTGH